MKIRMTLEKARQMILETAEERARWGNLFSLKYNKSELMDAIVVLAEYVQELEEAQADTSELTKVKRQLAASQAREAKLKKKLESLKPADRGRADG